MSQPLLGTTGPLYARGNPAGPAFAGPIGTIVFPATVNVADPAGLTDVFDTQLSVDAAGALRTRIQTVAAGIVFPVSPAILANSVDVVTTAATPGAGGVLATIASGSLPAGTYDVVVRVYFSVAGTKNNAEFRRGATVVGGIALPAVANVMPTEARFRAVLDGATAISVNATAADAVGTYETQLTATRIA